MQEYAVVGFGKFIKECRERAGMSRTEFREVLGVSQQTLSKWENDKMPPRYTHFLKMLALADLKLEDCLQIPTEDEARLEKLADMVAAKLEARHDVRIRGRPPK